MWPNRPKDAPRWPTFRGGMLDEENMNSIVNDLDIALAKTGKLPGSEIGLIYYAAGKQYVRESENGGFVNGGGSRNCYSAISMEVQLYVRKKSTGRRSPLYLILWIGGYGKGSIMHCGWQYPHCDDFEPAELEAAALSVYPEVVKLVYGDRKWDSEVQKFILNFQKNF